MPWTVIGLPKRYIIISNAIEKILLSTHVEKINKRNKRQERTLLITNKAIYNIDSEGLLSWLSSPIKRKIEILKIHGITVNDQGSDFVIHVPSEYDYHYSSKSRRDLIIQMIAKSFYSAVRNRGLVFYFKVKYFVDCMSVMVLQANR